MKGYFVLLPGDLPELFLHLSLLADLRLLGSFHRLVPLRAFAVQKLFIMPNRHAGAEKMK